MLYTTFGEDVGGEIFPGVTKIDGIWFGIRRSRPPEITEIVFRCDAPYDTDSFENLGPDYVIVMDVSTHVWEEIPDDLR